MSDIQKALFLESKQGKFIMGTRPIPKAGSGQLLVKIHTSALNPIDYKIQEWGRYVKNYPAILGFDLAGVVEEVGEGVQNFAKGDRVFAHTNAVDDVATGSFQQHPTAVTSFTAKIPPNLSFDQAATVPLCFDTAAVGLYAGDLGANLTPPWQEGGKGKYAGKPIVIMVVQLAKLSGFSPIITTASPAHEAELKALGATDFINRRIAGNDFLAALHKITQQPIEIAYDAVSFPETQKTAWSAIAPGGVLVLTLEANVVEDLARNRKSVFTYGNPHIDKNRELSGAAWSVLSKWLEEGIIKPCPFEVLPKGLNGILDGFERMRAGKISGKKLVVHPQETG